jgi:hypothetical protein
MANDSQRDKARATFGKTFFENSKALPNPKNAAAALQKRANDRPIPTYKVGGAVKKATPPQPTAAEREAERKRRESLAKAKVTQSEADTLGRAMRSEGPGYKMGGKVAPASPQKKPKTPLSSDELERRYDKQRVMDLLVMPQKPTGYSSSMKSGGKANAGAKRAMKAEQDFTGLMRDAAARAAAKGTPVMKQGGATNEYTAKRVMSRIKAGNFKDGGRAELLRDRRMKDIEKDYKIALAKGKNEGVAKAKYEQRKADAADDYAKRTKGDRTATRAAEKASEATLKEARSTKGASITRRDMAADFKKYFADKPMTAKAAEPAKAAETAAKPKTRGEAFKAARKELGAGKTFTYEGKSYSTNFASEGLTGTGKGRAGTGRVVTGTGSGASGSNAGNASAAAAAAKAAAAKAAATKSAADKAAAAKAAAAATAAAAAKADKAKSNFSPINAIRSPGFLSNQSIGSGKITGYQGRGDITVGPQEKRQTGTGISFGSGKLGGYKGRGDITVGPQDPKKLAAGGAGKVRKGMMKGK